MQVNCLVYIQEEFQRIRFRVRRTPPRCLEFSIVPSESIAWVTTSGLHYSERQGCESGITLKAQREEKHLDQYIQNLSFLPCTRQQKLLQTAEIALDLSG